MGEAETEALETKRSGFDLGPACHSMTLWLGKSHRLSEPWFLHLQNGAGTQIVCMK